MTTRTFRLQISKQRSGYLAEALEVLPGGHMIPLAARRDGKTAARHWLERQRDLLADSHRTAGVSFDVVLPWSGAGQRYREWPET